MITSTKASNLNCEPSTNANLFFLSRDDKYKTEKPYVSRYDPKGLFPPTNIEVVTHEVKIQSLRPFMDYPSYEKMGFETAYMDAKIGYRDYENSDKIQDIHLPEVELLVKSKLGACQVHSLGFTIRRQHAEFPVATGQVYDYAQPSSRVHIDYTREYVREALITSLGNHSQALHPRWQCVNVWHPLKGPVKSWPIALCDASTVDFENDTMASDIVDSDSVVENMQVHYNSNQQWYWLPEQLPSELLIFKSADSQSAGYKASSGTAHSAFEIPGVAHNDPRESIEMRFLLLWHAEDHLPYE